MNSKETMERLVELQNAEDETTPFANAIVNLVKDATPAMQNEMLEIVGNMLDFADYSRTTIKSDGFDEAIKERMRRAGVQHEFKDDK